VDGWKEVKVKCMTYKVPLDTGNSEAANIDWAHSKERLFQVSGWVAVGISMVERR